MISEIIYFLIYTSNALCLYCWSYTLTCQICADFLSLNILDSSDDYKRMSNIVSTLLELILSPIDELIKFTLYRKKAIDYKLQSMVDIYDLEIVPGSCH